LNYLFIKLIIYRVKELINSTPNNSINNRSNNNNNTIEDNDDPFSDDEDNNIILKNEYNDYFNTPRTIKIVSISYIIILLLI